MVSAVSSRSKGPGQGMRSVPNTRLLSVTRIDGYVLVILTTALIRTL